MEEKNGKEKKIARSHPSLMLKRGNEGELEKQEKLVV